MDTARETAAREPPRRTPMTALVAVCAMCLAVIGCAIVKPTRGYHDV